MPQKKTRKCHSLFQWYLKQFSDDQWKIFSYDLERDSYADENWVTPWWMWRRPYIFVQRDLDTDSRWDDSLEVEFGKIEDRLTKFFDDNIGDLLQLKYQPWRDQYILDMLFLMKTKIFSERMISSQAVYNVFKKNWDKIIADSLKDKDIIDQYWEAEIREAWEKMWSHHSYMNQIKYMMTTALSRTPETMLLFESIKKRDRVFKWLKSDELEFIVSDYPFYFFPSTSRLHDFSTDPKTEITVVLHSKLAITIWWWSNWNREMVFLDDNQETEKFVHETNLRTASNARWFIAGSDKNLVDQYVDLKKGDKTYAENIFANPESLISRFTSK